MMEAPGPSEMTVLKRVTRRNIPEDGILQAMSSPQNFLLIVEDEVYETSTAKFNQNYGSFH
jgi:hypothetical protein